MPSEQLFSSRTDLLSKKRNQLKADIIRRCMCLSNWWLTERDLGPRGKNVGKEEEEWLDLQLEDEELDEDISD